MKYKSRRTGQFNLQSFDVCKHVMCSCQRLMLRCLLVCLCSRGAVLIVCVQCVCRVVSSVSCAMLCLSLTLCVYLAVAVPCPLSPGVSWCCVSCAVRIRLALACSEWRWKAGRCPRESDHNLEMRTTGAYSRAHAKGKAEKGTSRYARTTPEPKLVVTRCRVGARPRASSWLLTPSATCETGDVRSHG